MIHILCMFWPNEHVEMYTQLKWICNRNWHIKYEKLLREKNHKIPTRVIPQQSN